MTDCIRKSQCHGQSRRGGLEQLLVSIAQKSIPCCPDLLLLQMVSLSEALRARNVTHSLVYGRYLACCVQLCHCAEARGCMFHMVVGSIQ